MQRHICNLNYSMYKILALQILCGMGFEEKKYRSLIIINWSLDYLEY